jgi:hypothetical protein
MAVKNKNPKIQKHLRDSLYQINRRTVFQILSWDYVPKGHVMTKEDSLKMQAGQASKVSGQEAPQDSTDTAPVPAEEMQQKAPANKPATPQTPPANPKNSATKPKNN